MNLPFLAFLGQDFLVLTMLGHTVSGMSFSESHSPQVHCFRAVSQSSGILLQGHISVSCAVIQVGESTPSDVVLLCANTPRIQSVWPEQPHVSVASS